MPRNFSCVSETAEQETSARCSCLRERRYVSAVLNIVLSELSLFFSEELWLNL